MAVLAAAAPAGLVFPRPAVAGCEARLEPNVLPSMFGFSFLNCSLKPTGFWA